MVLRNFYQRAVPPGGAFSRDLQDQKSKSPLFPRPGGAVVTNDWCINLFDYIMLCIFFL